MDCPCPTMKIKGFTTIYANEMDDEMSEIEPLKTGELIEPIMFEPKRKIRLSRSTYKVNSYIDFRPYQDSFKKFEAYINQFSRDLWDPEYVRALVNIHSDKYQKPHVLVAKLFTIFTYKDLLRVLRY